MHISCQTSKKHQSGNSCTNREEVPRRWSDSLQLRPGGWSDSPQGVERIAPLGSLPTTSNKRSAHESGNSRTNREIGLPKIAPVPDFGEAWSDSPR